MTAKVLNARQSLQFLQEQSKDSPSIIAISGPTCSGKTTFATFFESAGQRNGSPIAVVPLDCFFRSKGDSAFPRDAQKNLLFDVPESFLAQEFTTAVSTLSQGFSTRLPFYDKGSNERLARPGVKVFPTGKTAGEGLFAGKFLQEAGLRVFSVFMDTPMEVCLFRRINRDTKLYGVSKEKVERFFRSRITPYWALCVGDQLKNADLIVCYDEGGG